MKTDPENKVLATLKDQNDIGKLVSIMYEEKEKKKSRGSVYPKMSLSR